MENEYLDRESPVPGFTETLEIIRYTPAFATVK